MVGIPFNEIWFIPNYGLYAYNNIAKRALIVYVTETLASTVTGETFKFSFTAPHTYDILPSIIDSFRKINSYEEFLITILTNNLIALEKNRETIDQVPEFFSSIQNPPD